MTSYLKLQLSKAIQAIQSPHVGRAEKFSPVQRKRHKTPFHKPTGYSYKGLPVTVCSPHFSKKKPSLMEAKQFPKLHFNFMLGAFQRYNSNILWLRYYKYHQRNSIILEDYHCENENNYFCHRCFPHISVGFQSQLLEVTQLPAMRPSPKAVHSMAVAPSSLPRPAGVFPVCREGVIHKEVTLGVTSSCTCHRVQPNQESDRHLFHSLLGRNESRAGHYTRV